MKKLLIGTFCLSSLLLVGCDLNSLTAATHDSKAQDAAAVDAKIDKSNAKMTASGNFEVIYSTQPNPLPLNESFTASFMVHDKEGKMVKDAAIKVDANMPAHGHGMNVTPEVTADGTGSFKVEGLLFHMPGHWEMTVSVTSGDTKDDVAKFDVNLK